MSWRGQIGVLVLPLVLALPAAAPAATPSPGPESGIVAAPAASTSGAPAVSHAPGKRRAPQWYTASEGAGTTQNCDTQSPEPLGNAWTGWYGDLGVTPQKNQVYYVQAGWGIAGNPCHGGAGVHVEFVLPAYTQLAITSQNRVRCWYESPTQNQLHEFDGGDCPQNPQSGLYGGYAFDPPGNQGPWPSAVGSIFEIWVPVKTSQPLNGLEPAYGQPCYTCVYAGVWMIDGWNSPWVWPREGVYVVGNSTPTNPTVTYPGPSVTDVFYDTGPDHVQARLNGNIFASGPGGEAYYQFGNEAGNYPDESAPRLAIPANGDFLVYSDFGFPPGKDFHWRFCYKPTGSAQICGRDQVYQAPPETGIQNIEIAGRRATVSFDSPPVPNMTVTFRCKLDGNPYKPCTSPATFKRLKRGNHTVSVRAVDQDGHKDSTPAKQGFKI
ncbi:MAG: hypothetical protein ACR2G3_04045 [Solirubrobacterales bacterium]